MSQEPLPTLQPITAEEWRDVLVRKVAPEFEPHLRREYRRYPVQGEVIAHYTYDERTFKRTWPLLEISLGGITAKAYHEIPADINAMLEVRIDGDTYPVAGRVRHCTSTLGGFKIGIQLRFGE